MTTTGTFTIKQAVMLNHEWAMFKVDNVGDSSGISELSWFRAPMEMYSVGDIVEVDEQGRIAEA